MGRETVRKWMAADNLWLSRKQRRTFHQPRLRRKSYGELIQIDGSDHRWFENHGASCTLLVFIDNAIGKPMQLRFVPSESTACYFSPVRSYSNEHGCPVASPPKSTPSSGEPAGGETRSWRDAVRLCSRS